jgi:hypothetical protein
LSRYLLVIVVLLVSATSASAEEISPKPETTTWAIVRTGELIGTERAAREPATRFFMAGECREPQGRRSLRCYFNSVAVLKAEGNCRLLATAWIEDLRLVKRTPTEIVWAGTKGPEGLAGAMVTTTLTVRPNPDIQGRTLELPGSSDSWEYESRTSFSVARSTGEPVTTRALKPRILGDYSRRAPCLPDDIMIDVRTP